MFGYNPCEFEDGRDFGDREPEFIGRTWKLRPELRKEDKSSESEEEDECMYKPRIIRPGQLDKKTETSVLMTRNDWRKAKVKPIAVRSKEHVSMYMMMTDIGTYSGGCDEDIFGWLRAFEDNFFISKDNRFIKSDEEASKYAALQLIAKLKDPARSMVEEFANKNDFAALYDYLVKTFLLRSGYASVKTRICYVPSARR